MVPVNPDGLRASAYGEEKAAQQRMLADATIRSIAHALTAALAFSRDGGHFTAGTYVGEAYAAVADLYFLLPEYERAHALVNAVRRVCLEASHARR